MAFTEDIDEFLDVDAFAEWAIYYGVKVKIIFDDQYTEEMGAQSSQPMAIGKASDYPDIAQGDEIYIGGAKYVIREYKPDAVGFILFTLEKQ